jgi:hypothetical protein
MKASKDSGYVIKRVKVKLSPKNSKYRDYTSHGWSEVACGASTLFDIMGTYAGSKCIGYTLGRTLADDSEDLRKDVRAVGRDFAKVARRAAARSE